MFLLKLSFLVLASTNVAIAFLFPGPCDSNPCKNGGKCKVVFPGLTYKCTCANGWKEKTCTVKVTPCDSSPCKNRATCKDKDDTFKCACKEGYFGETCSERIQCGNPLDLLFVVDAFSLQSTGEFDRVKEFMSDIIDWLKISDLAAKVGLIEFSYKNDTKVIFLPDTYSDASTLKNAISNLRKNVIKLFHGLEGYIAKALKLANDKVFKTADQHPNAAKAIVLLTQNLPLDSRSRAIEEAEKLKAKGVKIISIDLVTSFKAVFNVKLVLNELIKLSSPLQPISSAYNKLDDHVREVVEKLCSFTKDPCETMDCGERKICSYNRDTTSCTWNETNCGVGDRVIARWTNNKYYAGSIANISEENESIEVLFDDGDKITHQLNDVTAVFADKVPESVKFKDHVVAPWQGSYKQYIGFVIKVLSTSQGFMVRFDDTGEAWYKKDQLRILPDALSPHDVGARVFARWTNGLYYRGFVSKSDSSTVSIKYDDGDKITLQKNDTAAVILDKIPEDSEVKVGQKMIGYWPNRKRYYPGQISKFCDEGSKYFTQYNDGDERCNAVYEIRPVPQVLPCESNPCKNSGVCENVDENTFNCTCTDDWTGLTCEKKVHACDKTESPCKNNGVCEKNGDEFVCVCSGYWTGSTCEEFTTFKVGDRVIARWTNNNYYADNIINISEENESIEVLFDDGDKITHPLNDVTAVFADKVPESVKLNDHVVASWQGSYKQYIGFVIKVSTSQGFMVRFDDNDEAWYKKDQLRILPDASSPHDVGARVFARWTNSLYYRGFVSKSDSSTVSINYDDGDRITLRKDDTAAVILDKIPQDNEMKVGQKVIGYWPNRQRYYPGQISKFCDEGSKYFTQYNDGDERCNAVYEIRPVPQVTV